MALWVFWTLPDIYVESAYLQQKPFKIGLMFLGGDKSNPDTGLQIRKQNWNLGKNMQRKTAAWDSSEWSLCQINWTGMVWCLCGDCQEMNSNQAALYRDLHSAWMVLFLCFTTIMLCSLTASSLPMHFEQWREVRVGVGEVLTHKSDLSPSINSSRRWKQTL